MRHALTIGSFLPAILLSTLPTPKAGAADVDRKRFDPPRAYFTHSSLNKHGTTHAIKEQDNFLDVHITAIDNTEGTYTAEGFSYTLMLPAFVDMLDTDEKGLAISDVTWNGEPYRKVVRPVPPAMIRSRCLAHDYGTRYEILWFRIPEDRPVPSDPQDISVTLYYNDRECFRDSSRLKVHDALTAPRLSPGHFKLWLHGEPRSRRYNWNKQKYDGLAEYLQKAGMNCLQSVEALEYNKQMRSRGFYLIHQQAGSYHRIYKGEKNYQACITEGPAWFADNGRSEAFLPHADAVMWDFEPGASGKIAAINLDPWYISRFRKRYEIPDSVELTEAAIQKRYFKEWIDFRQDLAGLCIKHWADFNRAIKPDIETIVTEGAMNRFDPNGDANYSKYGKHVTYCDPMNFVRPTSLQNVKKWMKLNPDVQYLGCQNLGLPAYHRVYIADQDTMLQILGAALTGCKGTSIFPGGYMDAQNFVLFNRVMSFMKLHEALMFEGVADPVNLGITPLPKEDTEIDIGDGTKVRNIYPDWDLLANIRGYGNGDLNEYLAVVGNRNTKEPCYLLFTVAPKNGAYYVTDDENEQVFTHNGQPGIASDILADGIYVKCPEYDYRGFWIRPVSSRSTAAVDAYQPVRLEEIETEALAYAQSETTSGDSLTRGDFAVGFDDFNSDSKIEYRVTAPGQHIWVSRNGTILKWRVHDQDILGADLGLCRDMLLLPEFERASAEMDAVMQLEEKELASDHVRLVFSKTVPLDSFGSMVDVRFTKAFIFGREPGVLDARVTLFNSSLSMDVQSLDLSYRVHNYIDHQGLGEPTFWVNEGSDIVEKDGRPVYAVVNAGLSPAESRHVLAGTSVDGTLGPLDIVSFGEYFPERQLLLGYQPQAPSRLLQLLRWGTSRARGTVEWMCRPEPVAQGSALSHAYRITATTGVKQLTLAAVAQAQRQQKPDDDGLIFHVDFEDGPDAMLSNGDGKATVLGDPTYEDAPDGKGIVMAKGTRLSYLPAGNINFTRGKLYMRFKPLWPGSDGMHRFFMEIPGMYVGKVKNGRLQSYMTDTEGEVHYCAYSVRSMTPGRWHRATATWDTEKGEMVLFLDGERVAHIRDKPWRMRPITNSNPNFRLKFPGSEIVIDEIKIWDTP